MCIRDSFKVEGVPINVNYRYVEEELIYLLDNSDSEVVFFQNSYSERIKKIANQLPNIKAFIQVGGKEPLDLNNCYMYEEIISQNPPLERKLRSEDNIYMLYTGGTTGMPKGVMYKQGAFMSSLLKTAFAMGFDVPESHLDISKLFQTYHLRGCSLKQLLLARLCMERECGSAL